MWIRNTDFNPKSCTKGFLFSTSRHFSEYIRYRSFHRGRYIKDLDREIRITAVFFLLQNRYTSKKNVNLTARQQYPTTKIREALSPVNEQQNWTNLWVSEESLSWDRYQRWRESRTVWRTQTGNFFLQQFTRNKLRTKHSIDPPLGAEPEPLSPVFRIRIRISNPDPDPQAGQHWPPKTEKMKKFHVWRVWTSFVGFKKKYLTPFYQKSFQLYTVFFMQILL